MTDLVLGNVERVSTHIQEFDLELGNEIQSTSQELYELSSLLEKTREQLSSLVDRSDFGEIRVGLVRARFILTEIERIQNALVGKSIPKQQETLKRLAEAKGRSEFFIKKSHELLKEKGVSLPLVKEKRGEQIRGILGRVQPLLDKYADREIEDRGQLETDLNLLNEIEKEMSSFTDVEWQPHEEQRRAIYALRVFLSNESSF